LRIALCLLVLASAHIVSSALAQEPGGRPIRGTATRHWSAEIVTDDLSYPWDLNRVGDQIIITEAAGNIVVIENRQLRRYAVETSDPIVHEGGSGLLGMALAEDFQTSGLAYLYHSYLVLLGGALTYLMDKFAGGIIGKAAGAAWDALSALFGSGWHWPI